MNRFTISKRPIIRLVSYFAIVSTLAVTSGYAQTATSPASGKPVKYGIELVVNLESRSFETDADLIFGADSVRVVPDKSSLSGEIRELKYADIKLAEQSYSKKPLFSVGGGVTTVVLTSLLIPFIAIPFLFIKKKKHWMTVQTADKYAVLKLGDRNFRTIAAEFATHGVKVNDLGKAEK